MTRPPVSAETRQKLREAALLNNRTPERRALASQQQRARFADPAEREAAAERMRKVWADLRGDDQSGGDTA